MSRPGVQRADHLAPHPLEHAAAPGNETGAAGRGEHRVFVIFARLQLPLQHRRKRPARLGARRFGHEGIEPVGAQAGLRGAAQHLARLTVEQRHAAARGELHHHHADHIQIGLGALQGLGQHAVAPAQRLGHAIHLPGQAAALVLRWVQAGARRQVALRHPPHRVQHRRQRAAHPQLADRPAQRQAQRQGVKRDHQRHLGQPLTGPEHADGKRRQRHRQQQRQLPAAHAGPRGSGRPSAPAPNTWANSSASSSGLARQASAPAARMRCRFSGLG